MFNHRSYSGRLFRPKPEVYISADNKFLVVATPWGNREAARKTIEVVNDYLTGFFRDPDATSPFPKLSNLTDSGNAIRIAALLANDALYKNENKEEYKVGVELFIASLDGEELSYLQAGLPQVILLRKDKTPLPIGINFDLANETEDTQSQLHPLPDEYIGASSAPHLHVQSFKRHADDHLLLISHSWIPKNIYEVDFQTTTDEITRTLSQESTDQPFWLGVWSLAG